MVLNREAIRARMSSLECDWSGHRMKRPIILTLVVFIMKKVSFRLYACMYFTMTMSHESYLDA
jgi:hypothetical protein